MKTSDLIEMINAGRTRHGRSPDRIEIHPFDLESIRGELLQSADSMAVYASSDANGALMMFQGIPVFPLQPSHTSTAVIWETP